MVLSVPLPPPARFLLWVKLWVMGEWPQPIGENKGATLPHGLTQISLHLFLCKRSTIPPAPIYCPHSIPKPVFFLTDCLLTAPRNTSGPTQILRRCIQRGPQRFFKQFLMVYSRFCSVSFTLRHSLKTVFPRVPCLSVAVYVVKKIVTPKEPLHKHNKVLCNTLRSCTNRLKPF